MNACCAASREVVSCIYGTSPFLHGASSHSSSRSEYRNVAAQETASLLDRRSYCAGVRPDSLSEFVGEMRAISTAADCRSSPSDQVDQVPHLLYRLRRLGRNAEA